MTIQGSETLLSARDVSASLPCESGLVCVLDAIALDVASGEVVDVTGPSGAGKSTLLRALARLLPGATGELALRGRRAADFPPQEWRARVALLPQKPAIVGADVRANLLLPWGLRVRREAPAPDDGALAAGLDSLGLGSIGLDREAARLSVGQQARVALLRVLLARPEVLLLDEPDAALDSESALALAHALRAFADAGGAVVRVRHRGGDGLAARRLLLQAGRLAEDVAT